MTDSHVRLTIPQLGAAKRGMRLVVLTAYDFPTARRLDGHADLLLVSDMLGKVVYGLEDTLPVTLDQMIAHGAAVVRGSAQSAVCVTLPFASYQESPAQAFRSAARVLSETGCDAVAIEGGKAMAPSVQFLVERGIPVLAHLGRLSQAVHAQGGAREAGTDALDADHIRADAALLAESGAFAILLEAVPVDLAGYVARHVSVPVIGQSLTGGEAVKVCDGVCRRSETLLGAPEDPDSPDGLMLSEAADRFASAIRDAGPRT